MKKGSKGITTIILEDAKEKVNDCLKNHGEYVRYRESDIYIMKPEKLLLFDEIQENLKAENKKITRGKAIGLNKIVNLINPNNPAYQYNFTTVEKYVYLSTRKKCLSAAEIKISTSANISRKKLREYIDENTNFTEQFIEKLENELETKIKKEKERIEEIKKYPDICEDIQICGFKNRIEYGQVNYGYFSIVGGKEIKVRTNKHLSIIYPNVLFYQPDESVDNHRSLMEAKYLEEKGYVEIARDVFVKYKDGVKNGNII